MKRAFAAVGAATLLSALAGCAALVLGALMAGAVAVGTYLYVHNDLQREYEAPLEPSHAASVRAVEGLGVTPEVAAFDFQTGRVAGRLGDGRPFAVSLETRGETRTLISVRVGELEGEANRAAAQTIHERIHAELNAAEEREN